MNDIHPLVEHVRQSIALAEKLESNMNEDCIEIPGMTSEKIRHLLNNLVAGELVKKYLEIGVHRGATFFSAVSNNTDVTAIAIDNWSEFVGYASGLDFKTREALKNVFTEALEDRKNVIAKCELIDSDCWTVDAQTIKDIDCYFYDACHDMIDQKKALTHYWESMSDTFIFVVDDWTLDQAKNGTHEAIKELPCMILEQSELMNEYWNGIGIFVLQKQG